MKDEMRREERAFALELRKEIIEQKLRYLVESRVELEGTENRLYRKSSGLRWLLDLRLRGIMRRRERIELQILRLKRMISALATESDVLRDINFI